MKTYILIMAGGVGSRFWPKSRPNFPKQFIDIMGTGRSLLQMTFDRFKETYAPENMLVLTNETYADLVKKQLPEIPVENILLEPSRNNTAPCIAYAGYKILQKDPEATMVVVPSDHIILKEQVYLDKVAQAIAFAAQNDAIVTLGIQPTRPDTGYGYIQYVPETDKTIFPVQAFKEKPDLTTAESYLEQGGYLWNAGMFIWKAASLQKALATHAPEIDHLFSEGNAVYNTPEEQNFIQNKYPLSPNISIDYAVLEKANNIYTLPADIGWSDLGTWASLYDVLDKNEEGNTSIENVSYVTAHNNMVSLPAGKKALIKGLDNYIVVDDGSVLMIYPKNEEQSIKEESVRFTENYL